MVDGFICKMAAMWMQNNKVPLILQTEYSIAITTCGPMSNCSESKLFTVKLF